jgi:membrane protease YdiL (CAAX protease family)
MKSMFEVNATNLDLFFILAGIVVWAWVVTCYLFRRPCLHISPLPDPTAVEFGPEAIVLVLLLFLGAGFLVQELITRMWPAWGREGVGTLSSQVVVDTVAKVVALAGMILLFSKTLNSEKFFTGQRDKKGPLTWVKYFPLALMIFFALYPLVNVLLLNLGVFFLEKILHLPAREPHQAFELLNNPKISPAVKVNCLFLAAIVSPVVEEFFFRGLLQNLLYKTLRRPIIAILLTSLGFMLVHVPLYQNLPALAVLGGILGWSYYRYRTLAVPVLVHIIFNSASLILWWVG